MNGQTAYIIMAVAFVACILLLIHGIRLAQLHGRRARSVGALRVRLHALLLILLELLVALFRHIGIVFVHCGAELLIRN